MERLESMSHFLKLISVRLIVCVFISMNWIKYKFRTKPTPIMLGTYPKYCFLSMFLGWELSWGREGRGGGGV